MGIGNSPAGAGFAGFDVVTYPSPLPPLPDGVPYFDLSVKQYTFAADGSQNTVHPVDQMVENILGTQLGTFKSDPTMGVDWGRLRSATASEGAKLAAKVIATALSALVTRQDIRIGQVLFSRPTAVPGRTLVAVEYVNLRLPTQARNDVTRWTGRSF